MIVTTSGCTYAFSHPSIGYSNRMAQIRVIVLRLAGMMSVPTVRRAQTADTCYHSTCIFSIIILMVHIFLV